MQYRQKNIPFCILLIDFDKFKHINDHLGHAAGDKVLVQGAQIILKNLRNQDRIARWGGEEFLIILPGCHVDGAKIVADKIRVKVRDTLTSSLQHPVSVTIGVAEFAQNDNISRCLKRADAALYRGKETGRDRVEIATAVPES
jgi:diguanylate cyclase (GGDEF)-like protein